jgi:hypothetical protein
MIAIYFWLLRALSRMERSLTIPSSSMSSASSSRTRAAASGGVSTRSSHASTLWRRSKRSTCSTSKPTAVTSFFLDLLAAEEVVLDDEQPVADAPHLLDGSPDLGKVMRCDPAGDDVECAVLEGQVIGRRDDVGPHPRRGIDGDDGAAFLAQPARNVTAACGDVEHLDVRAGLAPLHEQVEVGPLPVRRALAESGRALRPDVGHSASSTARCAASSIVGST